MKKKEYESAVASRDAVIVQMTISAEQNRALIDQLQDKLRREISDGLQLGAALRLAQMKLRRYKGDQDGC